MEIRAQVCLSGRAKVAIFELWAETGYFCYGFGYRRLWSLLGFSVGSRSGVSSTGSNSEIIEVSTRSGEGTTSGISS